MEAAWVAMQNIWFGFLWVHYWVFGRHVGLCDMTVRAYTPVYHFMRTAYCPQLVLKPIAPSWDQVLVLDALTGALFQPQETTQPYALSVRDILPEWEFGALQVLLMQQGCVPANSLLALQVCLNSAPVYDPLEGILTWENSYSALTEKKNSVQK